MTHAVQLKPLAQNHFEFQRHRALHNTVCLGDMRPPGGTPLGNFSEGQMSARRLTLEP